KASSQALKKFGEAYMHAYMDKCFTEEIRRNIASELLDLLRRQKGTADIDSSLRFQRPSILYPFDYGAAGALGVKASTLARNANLVFSETDLLSLSNTDSPEEIPVSLSLSDSARSSKNPFLGLNLSTIQSGIVSAEKTVRPSNVRNNRTLHRKNLRSLEYVTAEFTGKEEAPVYGILNLSDKVKYPTATLEAPPTDGSSIVKWDGEWFITYEVFRDLGIAFAVVMVIIYLLVLGWFQDYMIPLIIMAPIPISLIGILPGHWITGAYFTATSMIGFIAGAGIIVRNSIILVDFLSFLEVRTM
ncbi:AcrB/AcrD/AcrF family protein, partial [Leptospira fluminis]